MAKQIFNNKCKTDNHSGKLFPGITLVTTDTGITEGIQNNRMPFGELTRNFNFFLEKERKKNNILKEELTKKQNERSRDLLESKIG